MLYIAGMDKFLASRLTRLDRIISWILVVSATVMIVSGYGVTRHVFDRFLTRDIHLWFEWLFVTLLALHFFIVAVFIRFHWKITLGNIRSLKVHPLLWVRLIQRVTGWAILFAALLVVISGLDWYRLGIGEVLPFSQHIRCDIYLTVSIIVHAACGAKIALRRKGISGNLVSIFILFITLSSFILVEHADSLEVGGLPVSKVTVGGQEFTFDPDEVETVRPDIFIQGHFSMFDVLVHLDRMDKIDVEYHFDESMNTHVIDSINGETNWWFQAYCDVGWRERNVFRMDHYPWKNGTTLRFFRTDPSLVESIFSVFREEVTRRKNNGDRLVIPKVIVRGRTFTKVFEDVEVTPHNVRSDVLQEDVTTAVDVIMSLGDQGKITYELKWYDSIGTAGIVKSYWVEAIDGDGAYSRCGFVYEAGSFKYAGFTGNHIHLSSDIRVLNSPEYVEFFWICI